MVQGETLEQQFGEKEVCFRTLDLYTSAVLESTLNPVVQPNAEFRTVMAEMSKVRTLRLQACVQRPPLTFSCGLETPHLAQPSGLRLVSSLTSSCGHETLHPAQLPGMCSVSLLTCSCGHETAHFAQPPRRAPA